MIWLKLDLKIGQLFLNWNRDLVFELFSVDSGKSGSRAVQNEMLSFTEKSLSDKQVCLVKK